LLHGADEICYSKIYRAKPAYQAPECKELHINWLHRIMLPAPHKIEAKSGSVNVVRNCDKEKGLVLPFLEK
jgi:hypothetical protein